MTQQATTFTTPVGRLVGGNVYEPRTTDGMGNPLTYRSGPNAGQPKAEYLIMLAIPKAGEQHWASTEWGAVLWNTGHMGFPNGEAQRQDMSWKITDGDSQQPNQRNVKPCDKPGYPGHWVLAFTSSFAPTLANMVGLAEAQPSVNPGEIQPGDYVQIQGSVKVNGDSMKPGIYLNGNVVCLIGYHPEGRLSGGGANIAAAGFGGQAPAGMVTTPPAAMSPGGAPAAAPAQGQYAPPPVPTQPQGAPGAPPAPAVPSASSAGAVPGVPSAPGAHGHNQFVQPQ